MAFSALSGTPHLRRLGSDERGLAAALLALLLPAVEDQAPTETGADHRDGEVDELRTRPRLLADRDAELVWSPAGIVDVQSEHRVVLAAAPGQRFRRFLVVDRRRHSLGLLGDLPNSVAAAGGREAH